MPTMKRSVPKTGAKKRKATFRGKTTRSAEWAVVTVCPETCKKTICTHATSALAIFSGRKDARDYAKYLLESRGVVAKLVRASVSLKH